MKALFVSNDPTIFVAGSAAQERMRTYAKAIGELHILSVAGSGAREEQDGSLYLHPVHAWRLLRIGALARRARSLILKYGIEVVSAQDPFEHGLAALKAVRGTEAKLHIQIHTDFLSPWFVRSGNWRSPRVHMPFLNRWRRFVAGRVLPQADGIRVVSERIKKSLTARYGSRIVEPSVIPVPIDIEVPPTVQLPAPPHPFLFTLVTVGRLEEEKRIEDIFAALALMQEQYYRVGLYVIGDGRQRKHLEKLVQKLGLADRVIFLGARKDARALMASAQAYIQASAYEGYGRTLIEAALAKVPIITTDVGIVGEVFRGYEEVLSVPVADPTALSYAIVGLLEDKEIREKLPQNAEVVARAHLAAAGDIPVRIAEDLASMTNP